MIDVSGLYEFCKSEQQVALLKAIEQYGNPTAAAKHLGIDQAGARKKFRAIKARAASRGYSPEHDMTKVAPEGFTIKGTSTLYDADGNKSIQWVKTSKDAEEKQQAIIDFVEGLMADVKPRTIKKVSKSIKIGRAHV